MIKWVSGSNQEMSFTALKHPKCISVVSIVCRDRNLEQAEPYGKINQQILKVKAQFEVIFVSRYR